MTPEEHTYAVWLNLLGSDPEPHKVGQPPTPVETDLELMHAAAVAAWIVAGVLATGRTLEERRMKTRTCPVDPACAPLTGWETFLAHIYEEHTEGSEAERRDAVERLLRRKPAERNES